MARSPAAERAFCINTIEHGDVRHLIELQKTAKCNIPELLGPRGAQHPLPPIPLSLCGGIRRYFLRGFDVARCARQARRFAGERAVARPITIKIKRLPGGDGLPLPAFATAHAAGADLRAAVSESVTIGPGEIRLIPCGFAMAIPAGYEAQVRPRSGLSSQHGVTLINTPGTIDADYRGEVQVPLVNHGREAFTVERGMRIAQMIIAALPKVVYAEVDELDETARGRGGFGHTGR
jgi:dUTP pyrophosphatase